MHVSVGANVYSSTARAVEDPLRPFTFRWGIRKPCPPVPAAPLIPVDADTGIEVSMEVNQILDGIRAGLD